MMKRFYVFLLFQTMVVWAEGERDFNGLSSLVGHCWQATFPDGKKIDTHCFSVVYQGAFIKDQHVVCGGAQSYYGETWYVYDAKTQAVSYRYYNSLGGVSDGTVQFKDFQLVFPDETYEKNGQKRTYKTIWTLAEGLYISDMWQQDDETEGGWKSIWKMVFKQIDLKQQNVAQFNEHRNLHCHQSE